MQRLISSLFCLDLVSASVPQAKRQRVEQPGQHRLILAQHLLSSCESEERFTLAQQLLSSCESEERFTSKHFPEYNTYMLNVYAVAKVIRATPTDQIPHCKEKLYWEFKKCELATGFWKQNNWTQPFTGRNYNCMGMGRDVERAVDAVMKEHERNLDSITFDQVTASYESFGKIETLEKKLRVYKHNIFARDDLCFKACSKAIETFGNDATVGQADEVYMILEYEFFEEQTLNYLIVTRGFAVSVDHVRQGIQARKHKLHEERMNAIRPVFKSKVEAQLQQRLPNANVSFLKAIADQIISKMKEFQVPIEPVVGRVAHAYHECLNFRNGLADEVKHYSREATLQNMINACEPYEIIPDALEKARLEASRQHADAEEQLANVIYLLRSGLKHPPSITFLMEVCSNFFPGNSWDRFDTVMRWSNEMMGNVLNLNNHTYRPQSSITTAVNDVLACLATKISADAFATVIAKMQQKYPDFYFDIAGPAQERARPAPAPNAQPVIKKEQVRVKTEVKWEQEDQGGSFPKGMILQDPPQAESSARQSSTSCASHRIVKQEIKLEVEKEQ